MSRRTLFWLSFFVITTITFDAGAQAAANPRTAASQLVQKSPSASEPLEISLVRTKIVVREGKEIKLSAQAANPGEILEEVATYSNKSAATLNKLEATLPVPAHTELLMASITPANAQASLDGKTFSAIPLKRKTRQADGSDREQPVPIGEYRYLRWYPGELQQGRSLTFSARFKVLGDTPVNVSSGEKKQ